LEVESSTSVLLKAAMVPYGPRGLGLSKGNPRPLAGYSGGMGGPFWCSNEVQGVDRGGGWRGEV
jgi:hypothetical protein